jgi:hypothetical protein
MTSLLMKVALAVALTMGSIVSLVGLSGLIIFADLAPPERTVVQTQPLSGAPAPLTIIGPNR